MEVEVTIKYDELDHEGGRSRDRVIRAIHEAMSGKANWRSSEDGWIASL